MTDTHPAGYGMEALADLLTPCVSCSEEESQSGSSSDEEELPEAPPAALCRTKSVSQSSAPVAKKPKAKSARKALAVKKAPVKKAPVKKAPVKRTVRRPYKSMPQEKLVSKKQTAQGRFDVVKIKFDRLQSQLDRFNNEITLREATATTETETVEEV
jgi:hypothetical protein